jgi:hypothetical protein
MEMKRPRSWSRLHVARIVAGAAVAVTISGVLSPPLVRGGDEAAQVGEQQAAGRYVVAVSGMT